MENLAFRIFHSDLELKQIQMQKFLWDRNSGFRTALVRTSSERQHSTSECHAWALVQYYLGRKRDTYQLTTPFLIACCAFLVGLPMRSYET